MRSTLSLDGSWQARLDPEDVGSGQGWARPEVPFDRELRVPMAWQAADPSLRQYAGVVWYRRPFRAPATWRGQSVAARFGAVDYEARVWLNGQDVGGHTGGYTPFEVELSPFLDWSGDNWLTMRVLDPAVLDEVPHGKQGGRWYTAVSGPWQSVALVTRPEQRLTRIRCYPDGLRGTVRALTTCRLAGSADHRVVVEALDGVGQVVAQTTALVAADAPEALVELAIPDPELWSPEAPHLYTLRATLRSRQGEPVDALEERFGLRTIEARDCRLYLNGQPLSIRGALDQAYWPETLYTAPSDAAIEREVGLAKAMGLNLLRKHLKPEDPRYLDACDRLGLLVWAEPANVRAFSPAAREAFRRDLFELMDRDFNRPSVIIWTLYNEDWGLPSLWSDPEQHEWLRHLYGEVKALDPTRLVCDNSGWAHVLTDLNDYHEYYAAPERLERLRTRLDFIARQPDDNYVQGAAPRGHEPLLLSEWGNWALPDPAAARARAHGADPAWFAYDHAYARAAGGPVAAPENPLTERIKTVAGFEERFEQLGLGEVFSSPAALCEHVQWRAFRSIKAQVEELRRRPNWQGWVVTEFSDIEWEANGWLDYWRQPKVFHRELADLNAPVALVAQPQHPSTWGGHDAAIDVYVSNTTPNRVNGTLRWRVADSSLAGAVAAHAGPFSTVPVAGGIRFTAPSDAPRTGRLELELLQDDEVVARGYAELAFAPPTAGLVRVPANGHQLDRVIRQRLERHGYVIPRSFDPSIPLAIVVRLDEMTMSYLQDGGRVLYLAGDAGEGGALAGLRFTTLSAAESWRMAAGAAWARVERLAPAPLRRSLGWEAASIFPTLAIEAGCVHAGDEQLAGWFEGWLANAGVFALRRRVGRGQLLATTFRFADAYGLDPVATLLLNRLVEILREH